MEQQLINIETSGRGFYEITEQVKQWINQSAIETGLCHLFNRHTSASLILCENADPLVLQDLEMYLSAQVADGDQRFKHRQEGKDDMAAHIRTILTGSTLVIPIVSGNAGLGTWQGIFVWEHRYANFKRCIVLTLSG